MGRGAADVGRSMGWWSGSALLGAPSAPGAGPRPPGTAAGEAEVPRNEDEARFFARSEGYQALQSRIAIGAGGVTGRGWLMSTQSTFGFLPYHQTDFVFPHLVEENGLAGAALVLGLFLALVLRALWIGARARDRFGRFVAVGIAAVLFWHVVVNVGMVSGLLPVVGVTLPLFSYGGSSALTVFLCLGLLLSISMRRA